MLKFQRPSYFYTEHVKRNQNPISVMFLWSLLKHVSIIKINHNVLLFIMIKMLSSSTKRLVGNSWSNIYICNCQWNMHALALYFDKSTGKKHKIRGNYSIQLRLNLSDWLSGHYIKILVFFLLQWTFVVLPQIQNHNLSLEGGKKVWQEFSLYNECFEMWNCQQTGNGCILHLLKGYNSSLSSSIPNITSFPFIEGKKN